MKKTLFWAVAVWGLFSFICFPGLAADQKSSPTIPEILDKSWEHFKNHKNFEGDWWSGRYSYPAMIEADGRPNAFQDGGDVDDDKVKDINWQKPEIPYEIVVVSESASYAMLRAVWMKDRATFDKIWKWTHDNLQRENIKEVYYWWDKASPKNGWKSTKELGLDRDALFSWRWVPNVANTGKSGVMYYRWRPPEGENDPNKPWRDGWDCAADADYDIALALIFADSLWGSAGGESYLNYAGHARQVLKDLWEKATIIIAGQRFVAGGDNIDSIEPGYLSPANYRIFNDFDPEHDWQQVVRSSYWVYKYSGKAIFKPWVDKTGKVHPQDPTAKNPVPNLVPDWCDVTAEGRIVDSSIRREPEFGTDAFRQLWRVALDKVWFNSPEANDYLKGNYNPTEFFKWSLFSRPGYDGIKNYDTTGKLASIYWHNGDFCDYESNYEPDLNDPARPAKLSGPRADSGAYGAYLAYFGAAGEAALAQKVLEPLITPEANGFSQKDYIIPPDWWEKEFPENRARQVPPEKRKDPSLGIGQPYSSGDGWLCQDKDGYYWTVYDQSDWNSQGDYFSNTWAWLGLGLYAGHVKNLYLSGQKEPLGVKEISFYSDLNYKNKIKGPIKQPQVYSEMKGIDGNPKNRDWTYVTVETTDKFKNCQTIKLKLAETGLNTGIYRGVLKIGLKSLEVDQTIGAAFGNQIIIYHPQFPGVKGAFPVGFFYLSEELENFDDGSISDASALYWWQDSLDPAGRPIFEAGKEDGFFLWKENEIWHLVASAGEAGAQLSAIVSSDAGLKILESLSGGLKKEKIPLKTSPNNFSFNLEMKNDSAGVVFSSSGSFLKFDLKENGRYQSRKNFVGSARAPAYSSPVILKNEGRTQSYWLSVSTENQFQGHNSLQVEKKSGVKDYPYFGAAGLKGTKSDWSEWDEFKMWVYLAEDLGPIQVDIEDQNGQVACLNAYNPFRPDQGAGWYLWSSNYAKGLAAKRELIDPAPIKFREFWKGWDENTGQPREISDFDLKNIRNIMFSAGGGLKKDLKINFARMLLVKSDNHSGESFPRVVRQITFYKDKNFQFPFKENEPVEENEVFVELAGEDRDPASVDKISLKVLSNDFFPGCEGINLTLAETQKNSGIFRGHLLIGLESDFLKKQIGSAEGTVIYVFSEENPAIKAEIKIGARKIIQTVDDFSDGAVFDADPITWWTDDLDPSDGKPGYIAGEDLGYYLWREEDLWNLRWSADQKNRVFTGLIKSDGPITFLQTGSSASKIEIRPNHKEITFTSNLQGAEDGFSFKASGDFFTFDIKIDNRYEGRKVQIGQIPYKKAYDVPFNLKNQGLTQTYVLSVSPNGYTALPYSMKVAKKYNGIKDYAYFGAWWGFSPELFDWSNIDEFKIWFYLAEDVGQIKVDLEDKNGQVVTLNGYNPWDPEKGAGWYLWSSNNSQGLEAVRGNCQPAPIKDRRFWKGWDENSKANIDKTKVFDLKNVINMQISVGGGLKKDSQILVGKLYLVKENNHLGFNEPKRVDEINVYLDPDFKNPLGPAEPLTQENIFLELKGQDSNPSTVDRIKLVLDPEDKFPGCSPSEIYLIETKKDSGIYRGRAQVGLFTKSEQSQVGACRDTGAKIYSPDFKENFIQINVGAFSYVNILDDFNDGKIFDENPLTWWTDDLNPEGRPDYEVGRDFGFLIWREDKVWHLRALGETAGHEFSGTVATSSEFEEVAEIFPKDLKNFKFEESRNTVTFKLPLALNEAGFDFTIKAGAEDFLLFNLKIDGQMLGKKVFVGPKKTIAYAIPFTLYNRGITSHYKLESSRDFTKTGRYSMKVTRKFGIKDYPYFGAWGLRDDLKDWSCVDELSFWIYLPQDSGEVRVDLEDVSGNTAVLNGYNPWDPVKGPGWYRWSSSFALGWQAKEGNIEPLPIKDRHFWKKWDTEVFNYVATDKIDLKNINNVQFIVGGRETGIEFETLGTYQKPEYKDYAVYFDEITLSRENFHLAKIAPLEIEKIELFKDPEFKNKISASSEVTEQDIFVSVIGADASPFTVDRFFLTVSNLNDRRPEAFPIKIRVQETSRNSGLYQGHFKLGLESNQDEAVLAGLHQGKIKIFSPEVSPKIADSFIVGKITFVYLIDDFSDGNIADRTPVTWWTDDLDPQGKPEYKAGKDLGFFIWRDSRGWHLRWSSDGQKHTFEGTVFCYKKPENEQQKEIKKESGFNQVEPFSLKPQSLFEQTQDEINFKDVRVESEEGEAGFDFKLSEVEYLKFDLMIDGQYLGRRTFVGETSTKVYSLPLALYAEGITKHLWITISDAPVKGSPYSLNLRKTGRIKDYPYFGLWGLKKKVGDLSNWTKFDRLKFLIHLEQTIGPVRAEIEDVHGTVAILNGYEPTSFGTSSDGWYLWNSSLVEGQDVVDKIADPFSFPKRKFWKKWDLETNRNYIDVTDKIDLKNIVSLSFSVGGGRGENISVNLGPIWLEKDN